jgi:asparagine synthase (glutamine-hydrolysing)
MAHSLELRSPLLDHRVVELGLALPETLKFHGREGKVAFRRAFTPELPAEVASRGKSGFGVPLARWFRTELRPLARDLLLDERARSRGWFRADTIKRLLDEHMTDRADHGHVLWTLCMLELWQRTHVEAEAASPVPTR